MANKGVKIITAPYDSGHHEWRMGRGPVYVLEHGLRDTLVQSGYAVSSEMIEVDFVTEIACAFGVCRALSEQVKAARQAHAFPLLLTGNCGSALGTVSGIDTQRTGVIWFDAHGEFNTPSTTRSGFLDGMGLATLTGRCWQALAATVPGFRPMPDQHIILVGARDLDGEERLLLDESGIVCISPEQLHDLGPQAAIARHLERLRQRVEQVYVHLDLDALDPSEAHANTYPTPNGLMVSDIKSIIEAVKAQFRIVAGGLASFDPECDTDQRALRAALELLKSLVN